MRGGALTVHGAGMTNKRYEVQYAHKTVQVRDNLTLAQLTFHHSPQQVLVYDVDFESGARYGNHLRHHRTVSVRTRSTL